MSGLEEARRWRLSLEVCVRRPLLPPPPPSLSHRPRQDVVFGALF